MLGKFLKHEYKATARYFIPLYAGLLAIAAITRLSAFIFSGFSANTTVFDAYYMSDTPWINTLIMFLQLTCILGFLALFIISFFLCLQRFYKSLFGNEGYLTFTLPISLRKILAGKLIVSATWLILTVPVALLAFFILFFRSHFFAIFPDIFHEIPASMALWGVSSFEIFLYLFLFILLMILSLIFDLLIFYLSMTLGHMTCPDHPLVGSIAFYVLIAIIESVFSLPLLSELSFYGDSFFSSLTGSVLIMDLAHLLIIAAVFELIHYLLKKKLNLN